MGLRSVGDILRLRYKTYVLKLIAKRSLLRIQLKNGHGFVAEVPIALYPLKLRNDSIMSIT